jgi:hypothetical protein
MLRALTFSVLCGGLLFGLSLGDVAEAAKKGAKGPPRCMEAVVPKCAAPNIYFCGKKNKCGACAKWNCQMPSPPKI